jgi:hypothetical protein
MKIYLFHTLGKFTRVQHKDSMKMEDLLIYLIHEEFNCGDTKLSINGKTENEPTAKPGPEFVVRTLLNILDNEVST